MTEDDTCADESVPDERRRIKVTIVGDSGVGKTCLLMAFANERFPAPEENINRESLFENSKGTIKAGGEGSFEVPVTMETETGEIEFGLTDTIGTENYRPLREVFGANTDVFIVCFSVTDPETVENVQRSWITEIRLLTPRAPFILVGTKTDLRDNTDLCKTMKKEGREPYTFLQGIKLAKKLGAREYVECSALNMVSVKSVFKTVVLVKESQDNNVKGNGRKKNSVANPCAVS